MESSLLQVYERSRKPGAARLAARQAFAAHLSHLGTSAASPTSYPTNPDMSDNATATAYSPCAWPHPLTLRTWQLDSHVATVSRDCSMLERYLHTYVAMSMPAEASGINAAMQCFSLSKLQPPSSKRSVDKQKPCKTEKIGFTL